jgi:hypothetical protein
MKAQMPSSKLTNVLRGEDVNTSGVTISQPTSIESPGGASEDDETEGIR